jgi:uncharacterized membrane protein YgcG
MRRTPYLVCAFVIGFLLIGGSVNHVALAATPNKTATSSIASTGVPDSTYSGESIQSFQTWIVLSKDGSALVTESIGYDFADLERHGIYRKIPQTQVPGNLNTLELTNFVVYDENSSPYNFTGNRLSKTSGSWAFVTQIFRELAGSSLLEDSSGGDVNLKIGDADTLISGRHTYNIQYEAANAIGSFSDRDEIYWNSTGNGWEVPIRSAETYVFIPADLREDELTIASYCGRAGEQHSCEGTTSVTHQDGKTAVTFIGPKNGFEAGQGMTVAVGFPKGLITPPAATTPTKLPFYVLLLGYWYIPATPLLAYFFLRSRIAYYFRRRAYYQRNVVIAEYDPGDITAVEAGLVCSGIIKDKDLSAEIIWLATRGYLLIKKVDGEYHFVATDKDDTDLPHFNRKLLSGVSGKSESDLKNSFYVTASSVKDEVISSVTEKGYLEPVKYKLLTSVIAGNKSPWQQFSFALFFAVNPGFFIWILIGAKAGFVFSGAYVLYAFLGLIFKGGYYRTDSGLEVERKLLGLKEYIHVAEEARITFHNAPEKNLETFEKLLPYAMIFGLEKEWARQFQDVYTTQPSWYSDTDMSTFSAISFASSIHSFSSSTTASLVSSPSGGSSGGGFSGGGGGGGGGGSW